jgi:hypothetical protein
MMRPVAFTGDAFSEYFCSHLLWADPHLRDALDPAEAEGHYGKAAAVVRRAQRELADLQQARSTYTHLLNPLAELLGWHLGPQADVATAEGEEEGGVPLLDGDGGRTLARAVCISPSAHLDAAPAGLNRRFAPSLALTRVLREADLSYGLLCNAFELRLVCVVGPLPSAVSFDLGTIAEKTAAGLESWKLLHALLRRPALAAAPPLLDRVRTKGKDHQVRVSTDLGSQVQQAVVRFLQGLLDHPANQDRLPRPVSDEVLKGLYLETLRLLYRLLFVLYAEDLALLPVDMLTYREGYSLKWLLMRTEGGDAVPLAQSDPNGSFFQASLQALFGLLRQGAHLGPEGEIRPYGGQLFEPAATARLDGLVWGNAAVAEALGLLIRVPAPRGHVGQVRLSYRELNVEQLGAIYEGLLEQAPAYAHCRMWRVELDSRLLVIDDPTRERIRAVRGERVQGGAVEEEADEAEDDEPADEAEEAGADGETDPADDGEAEEDEEEAPPRRRSAKKPLKVLAEIPAGRVFLKGGQARKQSGSYYTNRAFVDFLVRETIDPMARDNTPRAVLALKVVDPAMGSGHFLVGACRRLAEHLLVAYRVAVARLAQEPGNAGLSEGELLELAEVPDELVQVWNGADQERELAVCRLLVAGNCIYGVDKNPLAVDLAKVSLWLVTAAARHPLTFLDHRLRCGDSLLGIPAEEVVRPWVAPPPARRRGAGAAAPRAIPPVQLLVSPRHGPEPFHEPSRAALCQAFARAFKQLEFLQQALAADPANLELHRARHLALCQTLAPWWEVHQLRVGLAFAPPGVRPDILNAWLEDILTQRRVGDAHREEGQPFRRRGEELGAFCWELAFPEVFYGPDGARLADGGFSCILGNPPWDKIKPERDGFYLAYDPLIRQLQGTEKNRRIEELHRQDSTIGRAWQEHEATQRTFVDCLLYGGIYSHQMAIVEEEVDGDDGEITLKRKTTGGDPDCFKFFLERAWQLVAREQVVGMVMSSGLHSGQGCTGLRRLLLNECRLLALIKFDNERKVFPGVHNQFKFDLVVFHKGGTTEVFDAAFFSRETEQAIHHFRSHRCHLRMQAADIHKLSPQMLTLFEFRGQADIDLVEKAYRLHPTFGEGLMPQLGLKYRCEFHMGNMVFLFRTRDWLRKHGCTQEPGEQWRAADAVWYAERGYIERPIARWYVLYEGDRVKAYELPWPVRSAKAVREEDLHDFAIRRTLPGGFRLIAKGPEDGGHRTVFVPPEERRDSDLPAYVPGVKRLSDFTVPPALRPMDVLLPFVEAKWIYHFNHRAYAYVSGSGSWIVTRPAGADEQGQHSHYFMARLDAETRTPSVTGFKVGFRDVSSASNERTAVAAAIPAQCPCNDKTPTFASRSLSADDANVVIAWLASFAHDFLARTTGGSQKLFAVKTRPAPCEELVSRAALRQLGVRVANEREDGARALLDAVMAELVELTPHEYAYVLSTFPLLDRDQPPLPHDYRLRPTNKGLERRQISFITRDLALRTYFDYLAGRLDIKPEPARVARICSHGVPEPPTDIVAFFAEAGVDIGGRTENAVAATGPVRDLRRRVALARELGAVAYVPTIDRRRARFVEAAAEAGGLSPEEGVLTPEMARRVLRDKAEREAKWQRAMQLWATTPPPKEASAALSGV